MIRTHIKTTQLSERESDALNRSAMVPLVYILLINLSMRYMVTIYVEDFASTFPHLKHVANEIYTCIMFTTCRCFANMGIIKAYFFLKQTTSF